MISEKKVTGIDNTPILVKKKNVPQSVNQSLPLMFNTQLYIGSKGTGKTYKLVQLLKLYEDSKIKDNDGIEYEIQTILISPTANSGANEIFKTLKSLDFENDVYLEYNDELLLKILDDIKKKDDEFNEYINYKKLFNKFKKIKNIKKLNDDELEILEQNEFMDPDEVFAEVKPKVIFLILDDLVGSGAFSKKSKSVLSNLVIKHRHLKTNLIFTTQSFKAIPSIIRTNIDIYAIFKSSSYDQILNKIYDDISGFVKKDDFIQLYEYATQQKNDALIIINNSMGGNGTKFYKNWDTQLLIN
jgi:hypothetical protein